MAHAYTEQPLVHQLATVKGSVSEFHSYLHLSTIAFIDLLHSASQPLQFPTGRVERMALSGALVGWLSGTTIKHLILDSFNKLPIPLPALTTQQAIVAEIEAEQALVAANRELITRFEQKIQAPPARIWGSGAEAQPV